MAKLTPQITTVALNALSALSDAVVTLRRELGLEEVEAPQKDNRYGAGNLGYGGSEFAPEPTTRCRTESPNIYAQPRDNGQSSDIDIDGRDSNGDAVQRDV